MSAAIDAVRLSPYRLPLRIPWRSARARMQTRDGLLLRLCAGRHCGYGDCAPLPAMGSETLRQSEQWLAPLLAALPGTPPETALAALPPAPGDCLAARCALETALLDLLARQQARPLRHLLAPGAADQVPVNAVLAGPATADALREACARGFRVLKLKLGLAPPAREIPALQDLSARLPRDCRLRLDINGAWDPDTAKAALHALRTLPVESLEEPCAQAGITELRALQAEAAFPLAIDESLGRLDPQRLLQEAPVQRLVLKPVLLGGLLPAQRLARAAADAGMQALITSAVESSAGLWASAQLAAALAAHGPALPQGLATAACLAQDLGDPPPIAQGRLILDGRPGSGFEPRTST